MKNIKPSCLPHHFAMLFLPEVCFYASFWERCENSNSIWREKELVVPLFYGVKHFFRILICFLLKFKKDMSNVKKKNPNKWACFRNFVFNIFFHIIICFPSKLNKKWNVKKKEQTNEQTFFKHIHHKETRPHLPPPPKKNNSAAVRLELTSFGSLIQCVIHSANMILFERVILSRILRKYLEMSKMFPSEVVSPWSVF